MLMAGDDVGTDVPEPVPATTAVQAAAGENKRRLPLMARRGIHAWGPLQMSAAWWRPLWRWRVARHVCWPAPPITTPTIWLCCRWRHARVWTTAVRLERRHGRTPLDAGPGPAAAARRVAAAAAGGAVGSRPLAELHAPPLGHATRIAALVAATAAADAAAAGGATPAALPLAAARPARDGRRPRAPAAAAARPAAPKRTKNSPRIQPPHPHPKIARFHPHVTRAPAP